MNANLTIVAVLAACGPGLRAQEPKAAATVLDDASGNERAIRDLLTGEIAYAGLWFPDPACTVMFPTPRIVRTDKLDALAHCLAGLHWHSSPRKEQLADVVVLTYQPGFEIEARVLTEHTIPRVTWIGFVSRRDEPNSLPSVAPEVLDALRVAGERNGPIDPALGSTLELDQDVAMHAAYAWFQVCLDGAGNVTSTHVRKWSSGKAAHAFADATAKWKFHPFKMGSQTLPVCSLVRMTYPATATDQEVLPLPLPPSASRQMPDEDQPAEIPPKGLEAHRIAGETLIEPDDEVKTFVQKHRIDRLVALFRLCVSKHGHVEAIDLMQSSGFASYDAKLAMAMRSWVYAPVVIDDKPVPVCTAVTFIYSQH